MRKKIPIFIISLLLVSDFLMPALAFAETYSDCPTTNPAETVECIGDKRYAGYQCRSKADIDAKVATCTAEETYKCLSHECECSEGYISCPGGCQLPIPPQPACETANRNTNQCSGECTTCKAGYTDIDPGPGYTCVASCDPATELRTSAGCISMETVASLIAPVFGTTLANLTSAVAGILANITSDGIDYYLLVATGDGGAGVRNYLYGSGKPDVYLEADIASTVDITGGTAGQVLTINITEDGTEWTTPAAAFTIAAWAGFTPSSYNGNRGGYAGADVLCNAAFAGSHVCTVQQILYIISKDPGSLPTSVTRAWVNGGPPGYTEQANDCVGWTSLSTGSFGRYWKFDDDTGWLANCSNTYQFACCQ